MSANSYGTRGKALGVDLTKERINEEFLSEELFRNYLGGTALGVKFLCDQVDPKINWSNPENCFFLVSGI